MPKVQLLFIISHYMSIKDSSVCLGAVMGEGGVVGWANGTTALDSKLSHIWSDKFALLLPFFVYFI